MHDLDQHYPVLTAPTGSRVTPRSSVSLCVGSDRQSLQVAVSPCCIWAFPSVISADLSSDPWTPLSRWLTRCTYPFLPRYIGLPQSPSGSANPQIPLNDFRAGAFRSCSHSIMFKPPSLLPPRSLPPPASRLNARAAVAFTSEQNAVRYLPAHRICQPSEWVIDGRGLSPPRSAALLAAPGLHPYVSRPAQRTLPTSSSGRAWWQAGIPPAIIPLAPHSDFLTLRCWAKSLETICRPLRVAIVSEMSIEIFENLIPSGFKSLGRVLDGKSLVGQNQFAVGTQVPQLHSYQRLLIVPS